MSDFNKTSLLSHTLILMIIVFTSCGHGDKTNNSHDTKMPHENVTKKDNKFDNALSFINAYVENSNKLKKAIGTIDWVNSNSLATKGFKIELKRIIDEAYKKDPELGLGFDPIVDAQDNPSSFELESIDEKTNYLIVKGKDWPEFKLTIKIIEENGVWLVDGCGIVNIPDDKRANK